MSGELWIVGNPGSRRTGQGSRGRPKKKKQTKKKKRSTHGGVGMPKKKRKTPARGKGGKFKKGTGSKSRASGSSGRKRPYKAVGRAHKAKRVVRNPRGGKGPLSFIGLGDVDVLDLVGGTGIAVGSRLLPSFLKTQVNLPTTGFAGYGVQLAAGLGLSYVAEKFLKMRKMAQYGRLFTISNVLTRLADDLIFKGESLGSLAGFGQDYPPDAYARAPMLEYENMLGQFPWDTPDAYSLSGQYTPGPEVEKFKSRF